MTMKKALIASTALLLTAGVAAADVTISGYGRTGVIYQEGGHGDSVVDLNGNTVEDNETRIVSRMRLNIDASTSTDQGVEFGGRIRLQWDQGNSNASNSPAYLFVTSNGLTVSVGNVNTAYDEAGLLYEMELGAYDWADEDQWAGFYAFSTGGYGAQNDRVGVAVKYEIDSLTLRASYVNPDQTGITYVGEDEEAEVGISADYVWNEKLELSGAYVTNGAGIDGNDQFFLGARYAVLDNARIGLNYLSADDEFYGDTVYLYGDYTLADGNTNIEAYIGNNNGEDASKESDNAYGVGVNYDLGGARLGASLHSTFKEQTRADLGVRFDF